MLTSSRTRRRLVTAVMAGLALSALGAGTLCLASSSRSSAWQGGWGSAHGWWGKGWWGTGRFLSVLPWDYQSFSWHGKPYYFGGAAFYAWNGTVGKYEQVTPPIGFNLPLSPYVKMARGIPKLSTRLFVYPEAGQTAAKQAGDTAACHKLAAAKYTPRAPHYAHAKARPARLTRRGPRAAHGRRRFGRRRRSAPVVPAVPPDTLTLQHSLLRAEAACLRKKHYAVR